MGSRITQFKLSDSCCARCLVISLCRLVEWIRGRAGFEMMGMGTGFGGGLCPV